MVSLPTIGKLAEQHSHHALSLSETIHLEHFKQRWHISSEFINLEMIGHIIDQLVVLSQSKNNICSNFWPFHNLKFLSLERTDRIKWACCDHVCTPLGWVVSRMDPRVFHLPINVQIEHLLDGDELDFRAQQAHGRSFSPRSLFHPLVFTKPKGVGVNETKAPTFTMNRLILVLDGADSETNEINRFSRVFGAGRVASIAGGCVFRMGMSSGMSLPIANTGNKFLPLDRGPLCFH